MTNGSERQPSNHIPALHAHSLTFSQCLSFFFFLAVKLLPALTVNHFCGSNYRSN